MPRIGSLLHAPAETRRFLRDRLARYLPSQTGASLRAAKQITLTDELLLHLLLNLSVHHQADIEATQAIYQTAVGVDDPTLDELIEIGWLRVIWGRTTISHELFRAVQDLPPATLTALAYTLKTRDGCAYHFDDAVHDKKEIADTVAAITSKALDLNKIGSQTPEWVAARLWDRSLNGTENSRLTLRRWMDYWGLLGYPSLVSTQVWNDAAAKTFQGAAMSVLASESSLVGWDVIRTDILKRMALATQRAQSDMEGYVPLVPATLVDRALWLEDHRLENFVMRTMEEFGDIYGLIRLLLAEVSAADHGPAPHPLASQLIALAIERPVPLSFLLLLVSQNSALIADLLLFPATSGLACLLIAQWQAPSSAWNRELTVRDNQSTMAIAFADAVSVMEHFLAQGSLRPEEVGSLLSWMHLYAAPGFIGDMGSRESMLDNLRNALAVQQPSVLTTMVTALTASTPQLSLGTSIFAASLDIVDIGNLTSVIDPGPLVSGYIQSIVAGAYELSANRIGVSATVALFALAMRAPAEQRQKFLYPLDIKAKLTSATDENPYTLANDIARSIRAHIRVLSRAITGWTETIPNELLQALTAYVYAGALSHKEKGRVSAFSPRYESDIFRGPTDRPIAADLGAALNAASGTQQEQLLAAILETDEPMLLAQLLAFSPHSVKASIRKRIMEFTPSDAGEIQSLPEAQARVEALLSVDMADVAARFIEAERQVRTLGKIAGREVTQLRTYLRLSLLRKDWGVIENAEPPTDLPQAEQASARETIMFYQAVAALTKPGGDAQTAERLFTQLQRSHTSIPAYSVNLFAARVTLLLGDNLFARLQGAESIRARKTLADSEQMMSRTRSSDDTTQSAFDRNKALLLLAIGQPGQALGLLTTLQSRGSSDSVAAYLAVALSRLGRGAEAQAILNHAERTLGERDVLCAARAHIDNGRPFQARASLASDENRLLRIKDAMFDLLQLDSPQQAEILYPSASPFDMFITSRVRLAVASVIELVPMMKHVDFTSSEDDLSALIRELLVARFEFLKWTVADQSKGGFTAKGNAGERDIVLKQSSATLAVIEAVVCKAAVGQQNLTRHFQKLLAYSTCQLFFHLSYVYLSSVAPVLSHLKHTAEHDAPEGFQFRGMEDIPVTDSRPGGFSARYLVEGREVSVVFLVLDLGQALQRAAAITAAPKGENAVAGHPN